MQKTAIVLLPVAILAAVLVFFLARSRQEPDGGLSGPVGILKKGQSPDSAGAESVRLRAENEKLKKEVEAARRRAEEAEARVAKLESGSEPAADPKKAGAKKGDWRSRRDAELEAKVKSMAWRKNVRGVIEYWKELEKARLEGRAPQFTPELNSLLSSLTADMIELSKFLGLEGGNSYDVFQNKVVGAAWEDAFFQETVGGTLTEEQLARLRATSIYEQDPDWDFTAGNILERWKKLIERNQAYGTETAGILTPEQQALVAKTVTPTYMLSLYAAYGERSLSGAGEVTDYWLTSFKLSADHRAAVEPVAAEYMTSLKALTQSYAAQYGATLPRDADFEFRLKALELQIAAEKRLSESLNLDPEQAKKLLKGSGSAIKLAN